MIGMDSHDKRVVHGAPLPDGGAWEGLQAVQSGAGDCTEEPSTSGRDASKAQRDEQWEARRRFNNMRRREKTKESHRKRAAAARAQQEELLSGMTPEQEAAWRTARRAARAARAAEEAAQLERVAAALAAGGPCGGPSAALRVAIDCSFSPSAPPKEMRSLCKQIENASATNKRHPRPACLTLTNWSEQLAALAAPCGGDGWRVLRLAQGPAEAFGADRVVVLSPDATEPLTSVDCEHAYVIGGIVDRTHRKGLTLGFAESQGLACRRLPIAEYAEPLGLVKGTRKCPVLNIDDVVRALLIQHETGDWVKALDAAIPARKRKPQIMGFTEPASSSSRAASEPPPEPAQQQQPNGCNDAGGDREGDGTQGGAGRKGLEARVEEEAAAVAVVSGENAVAPGASGSEGRSGEDGKGSGCGEQGTGAEADQGEVAAAYTAAVELLGLKIE
ncbi:hypothetical protein GPECTOR_5g202 [Gonium pectorale]|uniref:tRNA (guanine(9)-N(1))-methyltransferase n=1 Tax=Gonium pectorale TaxID=33097 RepID=A0A150GWC3_GONPE|nr:hypothetical protein GPECTOR_5g202 [Gonium pectorale]|eukprot:KXZ54099.1 hypothetical protein GPECTOR_5g202 [Gonium pectorale]